jgi:3-oxoacyl-[acyl-carrier-protein] synthase III
MAEYVGAFKDVSALELGDLVLLAAFGGGFTWGAALLRW